MVAGDDDHAVIEVAKTLAEGGELVGLTLGDGDAAWAVARGVDVAYSVADAPYLADEATTAAIMAAAVKHIGGVDVVVIGDAEQQHPAVPGLLAGLLGWPALSAVGSASADGAKVTVERKVVGNIQTVSAGTPVVLGVAAAGEEAKPPGMMQMLQARKKPVTTLSLADLGVAADQGVTSAGTALPELEGAKMLEGSPAEVAAALVAALRSDGVL
jgi:electron transfer flavoprotein beta subunit